MFKINVNEKAKTFTVQITAKGWEKWKFIPRTLVNSIKKACRSYEKRGYTRK